MSRDTIREGDTPLLSYAIKVGDQDIADVYDDLNNATSITVQITAPDGGTSTSPNGTVPVGQDSVVEYQAVAGTFDVEGQWEVQVQIEFSSGTYAFSSSVDTFMVLEKLP